MKQRKATHEELQHIVDALRMLGRSEARHLAPLSRPENGLDQRHGEGHTEEQELEGLYIISVAARLLGMHPQTLRKYERLGLVNPCRTVGMLRLYTERDIVRIRLIRYLQEDLGLNLAGVEVALNLVSRLASLHSRLIIEDDVVQLRALVEQEFSDLLGFLGLPFDEDESQG